MRIENTGVRCEADPGARGEEKIRVEREVLPPGSSVLVIC